MPLFVTYTLWGSLLFSVMRDDAAAAALKSWLSWLGIPELPSPLLSESTFLALTNLFFFHFLAGDTFWTFRFELEPWTFESSGSKLLFWKIQVSLSRCYTLQCLHCVQKHTVYQQDDDAGTTQFHSKLEKARWGFCLYYLRGFVYTM